MNNGLINIDLKPVADVVNKMIDKISGAIGWVVNHDTTQKVALKTFVEDIKKSNIDPLHKSILISNSKKILKEYKNQESIINIALNNLSVEARPQDVKDDWVVEFMEMAKLISDSEYQYIWGLILAGEMDNPGSFSIGAIDKLRCLSKKDAECFQKASRIALNVGGKNCILANSNENSGLGNYDFTYEDVLQLSDCGLMRPSEVLVDVKFEDSEHRNANMYNDSIVAVLKPLNDDHKTIRLRIFSFTEAGNQLLRVVQSDKQKDQILNELRCISNKFGWVEVKAYDVVNMEGDNIKYSNVNLLL